MRHYFIVVVFLALLSGCATGELWSQVDEGMTKEQVKNIIGKQDKIEKRENGWSIHWYLNRLISGFSWDKTDYYVIYNPDGKVDSYGHGVVDTRTSERMANWSINQQMINQQNKPVYVEPNRPTNTNCTSQQNGSAVTTNCTSR